MRGSAPSTAANALKVLAFGLVAALLGRVVLFQPSTGPARNAHVFSAVDDAPPAAEFDDIRGFVDTVSHTANGARDRTAASRDASLQLRQRRQFQDRLLANATAVQRRRPRARDDAGRRPGSSVRCGFLAMGGLPPSMQEEWDSLGCADALSVESATPPSKAVLERLVPPGAKPCAKMIADYGVVPGSSWGSLPLAKQSEWGTLRCDAVVQGRQRMGRGRRPPPSAAAAPRAAIPPLTMCPAPSGPLPLVAVCCGTTTRTKAGWLGNPDDLRDLALFEHLLPSVVRTVECGFRYMVVIGYDVGDQFWDRGGDARARDWFARHAAPQLAAVGIEITLEMAKVQNDIKKPGPVFTAITKHANAHGADYIYRVNDDTEFATRWAATFVAGLASLSNVGAVGPTCRQGNRKILTHDFTHRTHMDIFAQQYYPPDLSDWWMDDWISRVYGPDRTLRASAVEVIHHTGKHGQRYTVDKSHQHLLTKLLRSGARTIDAAFPNRGHPDAVPPGFERFGIQGHKW
ncbi:hypothetical protein M885DRAFT_619045 [Pelagophyceae sp. CCMP2097]|nr:hypothetical protein M885DRAFT_619045 [Pelagophyceae sp. CCMP2097]